MVQGKEEGLTMEDRRMRNFSIIAGLWSSYLGAEITPLDVSMMMCLLKVSEIKSGGGAGDSFADLAGYVACGAQIRAESISVAKKEEYGAPAEYDETSQQDVSFF